MTEVERLAPHDVLDVDRDGDDERDEALMARAVLRDLADGGDAHGE